MGLCVQETDALLVGGGDSLYLCYWMRQSGLPDILPTLRREIVYVGVSAESMVVTPISERTLATYWGETYAGLNPPTSSYSALGLVDFSLLPHLDGSNPENSLDNLERVAATIPMPAYAIDDQTAIKVTVGAVEVVSDGHWKLFNP